MDFSGPYGAEVKRLLDRYDRMRELEKYLRSGCSVYDTVAVRKHPKKCFLSTCQLTADLKCPYCNKFFCRSKGHGTTKEHKQNCRAYNKHQINPQRIEICATRPIQAGQLIHQDFALLEFPNCNYGHPIFHEMQNEDVLIHVPGFLTGSTAIDKHCGNDVDILPGAPVCFGCHSARRKLHMFCKHCQIPLCSEECELESKHVDECKAISSLNMNIWNIHSSTFTFHLDIATVRAIISCNNERSRAQYMWKDLARLPRYANFRESRNYKIIFGTSSLETILPISLAYSKDYSLVMTLATVICAMSDVYPWNLECWTVYPELASLKHSCIPNVQFRLAKPKPEPSSNDPITPNHSRMLRRISKVLPVALFATKPIDIGTPLTADFCFKSVTGRLERKAILRRKYIFNCQCELCLDPTDNGTFSNAVKCPSKSCVLGYMFPEDLTKPDLSAWSCNFCALGKLEGEKVMEMIRKAARDLKAKGLCPGAVGYLTNVQTKWSKMLHPNHYIVAACKKKLYQCVERNMLSGCSVLLISLRESFTKVLKQNPDKAFSPSYYQHRRDYCYSVLRHLNRLCPGINWKRGFVLRELFFTEFMLLLWETKMAKHAYDKVKEVPFKVMRGFHSQILRGVRILDESCEIIQKCYEPYTEEYKLANKSLLMIKNMLVVCKEMVVAKNGREYVSITTLRTYLLMVARAMLVHDPPYPEQETLLAQV